MNIGYIYKITNPNGAIYIGSTKNINRRKQDYKYLRCVKQIKIFRSLKKYGFENHKFEIITTCNLEEIFFYENYYCLVYDVLNSKNLNLRIPNKDDNFISVSDETRIKIGLSQKGKKLSIEHKKIVLNNLKKYRENNPHPLIGKTPWNKGKEFLSGKLNPMYGVKRSEQWKKNQSESSKIKNKKGSEHFKSKTLLHTKTGIYFFSVKEASISFNIKYSTLKSNLSPKRKNKTDFIYV